MRALWIEISKIDQTAQSITSRPVRALWIEMPVRRHMTEKPPSRPVRALWIEMSDDINECIDSQRRGP